jgi:heat-inducible transcriptional repressor
VLELDARKQEILRAVIRTYVYDAEPVGSERVAQLLRMRVSPATIRNEMAALEELGYLTHPHTSAGRVPTDQGYRLYVDLLLREEQPSPRERSALRRALSEFDEQHQLAGAAAHALATITDYASVASAPAPERQLFKHLHFLPLSQTQVMAVIVTDTGGIYGRPFDTREAIAPEALDRLSRAVSQALQGYALDEITEDLLARMVDEAAWQQRIVLAILQWLRERLRAVAERRVYIEGTANILKQPEFRDARAAGAVLAALEDEQVVAELLSAAQQRDVWVTIGSEHRREALRGTSVVAAPYRVHGRLAGALGIVGPTRMRYGRAIALVRYLASSLSEILGDAS